MKKKKYYKNCPYCDLRIESDSIQQFNWNYKIHKEACKKKYIKRINKEVKNDKNKSKH